MRNFSVFCSACLISVIASAGPISSSTALTTNNPELSASTSNMISNLVQIYSNYKCDEKTKKLDDKIKCSVIGEITGFLSSKGADGKVTQNQGGAFQLELMHDSMMYFFAVGDKDHNYHSLMNPLKNKYPGTSESRIAEQATVVLGATIYGPASKREKP
ncbi:hypothetical protein [Pseudomonas umsongensis]|uniref:hypothetical protein n=1 Tax=Pseudomonas umsongensis TaxID=198618 RepID=UPI0015B84633|nr:hypothetical protein [Pseudomonas umsongensis]